METKKARLQDDFGIAMTEEFESKVQDMCNLGKALVEQGIEQGIVKGIEQGMEQGVEQKNLSLAEMMLKDKEPIDKIKKYTGFATDKLEEIAKSMGMTLRNMVVEMHAFNITSEDEKKVFISYNLFYYRLAVLLYPRTSRPVLSRYLFREESRLTEHPGCTIYHQPLPDSTGGLGYWLWHLHERNSSLPRSHHRVLSWLWHIRSIVLLHIPVHPRLYLHNYTAIPCMHIYNCCGDN